MKKVYRNVELIANGLIIVVALLLITVVVQRYFLAKAAPQPLQPTVGEKAAAPDVDYGGQPKTLILALQASCHFCNESAPFYKRIIEDVKNKNVKIVAVFPSNTEESAAHLKELGLSNIEVRQSSLDSLKVGGTPTLILTNDKGEITDTWVGKLSSDKEADVLNKLNSSGENHENSN